MHTGIVLQILKPLKQPLSEMLRKIIRIQQESRVKSEIDWEQVCIFGHGLPFRDQKCIMKVPVGSQLDMLFQKLPTLCGPIYINSLLMIGN